MSSGRHARLILASPNRGFTLVELAVVLVIISLLVSAVVINTTATMQRFHNQRCLQEFLAVDQRARQLCTSSGRSAILAIRPQDGLLTLQYVEGPFVDKIKVNISVGVTPFSLA